MSLPTFLIIGAMKAGTSSLHNFLSLHPKIFMSEVKELNFFNTTLNWSKGLSWYESQFEDSYQVRGETSPNYSKWEGTAERIHSVLPDIKLIYLLRDPVQRFVSQCNHKQLDPNYVVEDLKKGIKTEIFTNGLYHHWYREYLNYYPKERILLVHSENLRLNRDVVLKRIFDFLEVDANDYDYQKSIEEEHVTSEKIIAKETVQKLNSNKGFHLVKRLVAPIKPLLKPIWDRLFYKKRAIRKLTSENEAYLKSLYKSDLEKLQKTTGSSFYYAKG